MKLACSHLHIASFYYVQMGECGPVKMHGASVFRVSKAARSINAYFLCALYVQRYHIMFYKYQVRIMLEGMFC